MQRLVTAAKKCPVKPTIAVWARLAEAAAWQLELPVLEELKDLVSEEASMAQACKYMEYQFFSLLLEKREQLRQELERQTPQEVPNMLWETWESSFSCNLGLAMPGKVKLDAVLFREHGMASCGLLCEVVDINKAHARALLTSRSLESRLPALAKIFTSLSKTTKELNIFEFS